jgi:hypothetical protein
MNPVKAWNKAMPVLTQSIAVLVNMINQRFLVPFFNSPVDSAAPTLPAGYSPPIPIPT